MGDVLIDACGWVALIDGSFNIDVALSNLVGPPHFILIDLVQEELEEIEANRPRGKKLMLDHFKNSNSIFESSSLEI